MALKCIHTYDIRIMSVFGQLWKSCSLGVYHAFLLVLTFRNIEAYLLPR
jgi:hypothetical protein